MTDEELRKIAENATPGPWYTDDYWGVSTSPVQHEAEWTIVDTEGCGTSRPGDHDFIAAFNPEMVLALLDRVETAEAELGRYDRRLERTENEYNRLETSHSILEAALARVREQHERTSFEVERRAYCVHCQLVAGVWPCPTIRALEGGDE